MFVTVFKAPFSIATTLRCRGRCQSFPRIAPLYTWDVPYNAECQARSYQVAFFKFLVWLDQGLNLGPPGHWRTLYPWSDVIHIYIYIYIYIYREREREHDYKDRYVHIKREEARDYQIITYLTYEGSRKKYNPNRWIYHDVKSTLTFRL